MGDVTRVKVERSAKRVRAYLGGEIIVDSIRSKLVWEVPQYPAYYLPMADVRMHHLAESDRKQRSSSRGEARYFDVIRKMPVRTPCIDRPELQFSEAQCAVSLKEIRYKITEYRPYGADQRAHERS